MHWTMIDTGARVALRLVEGEAKPLRIRVGYWVRDGINHFVDSAIEYTVRTGLYRITSCCESSSIYHRHGFGSVYAWPPDWRDIQISNLDHPRKYGWGQNGTATSTIACCMYEVLLRRAQYLRHRHQSPVSSCFDTVPIPGFWTCCTGVYRLIENNDNTGRWNVMEMTTSTNDTFSHGKDRLICPSGVSGKKRRYGLSSNLTSNTMTLTRLSEEYLVFHSEYYVLRDRNGRLISILCNLAVEGELSDYLWDRYDAKTWNQYNMSLYNTHFQISTSEHTSPSLRVQSDRCRPSNASNDIYSGCCWLWS